jgi:peptidoglycan/xylan/chitin deacetylase (PgdA/CDA1 family)
MADERARCRWQVWLSVALCWLLGCGVDGPQLHPAGADAGASSMAGSSGTTSGSVSGSSSGSGGSTNGGALGGGGGAGAGNAVSGSSSVAGSSGSSAAAGLAGTGGDAGSSGSLSGLPPAPGSADKPKPSGAVGGLSVLPWAGFKAAVSYTFDDSNSSQISHYDELDALGVHYTFYLQTGKSESGDPVWARAVAAGHELGNHTKSHSSNATGADVDAATEFIEEKFKVKVWTMAAPNGAAGYTDVAKTRFLINRGVASGLIGPNDDTDPFTLYCYIPPTGASQAAMDAQVTEARSAGKWRVVLVHGFSGGTDGAYQPVAFDQFSKSVAASKAFGDVWIDSVVNVGAYWLGQKAFSRASPATVAGEQTFSWSLPEHFPPGKFLRVSVTGGTLKQKGAALPWDARGYYEVALDAGSLTLGR